MVFGLWPRGLAALRHVESFGPGIEPMSPALAGGFLSTGATGKSLKDGSFSSCYLGTDELIMIIQFAYFFHFFFFKTLEVTPLPPSLHIVSDLFIFSAIK